jgi:glc operon protein GlcG
MPLTQRDAQQLIEAAQAHAATLGIRVTVAVVDEGTHLVALSRMDGAPPVSPQIAEAKAVGTAAWLREGDGLAQVQQERPAFFAQVDQMVRRPMMPGAGSLLIRKGDRVLGAVGVSGGRPDEDVACAQAGLSAVAGERRSG